jgi:hypothetical protein
MTPVSEIEVLHIEQPYAYEAERAVSLWEEYGSDRTNLVKHIAIAIRAAVQEALSAGYAKGSGSVQAQEQRKGAA